MRLAPGIRLTPRPLQGDAYLVDLRSAEILHLAPDAFNAVGNALQTPDPSRIGALPERSRRLLDRLSSGGWLICDQSTPKGVSATHPANPVAQNRGFSSDSSSSVVRRRTSHPSLDDPGRVVGLILGGTLAAEIARHLPGRLRRARGGCGLLGGTMVYALCAVGAHMLNRRLGARTGAQVGATLAQVRAEAAIEHGRRGSRARV